MENVLIQHGFVTLCNKTFILKAKWFDSVESSSVTKTLKSVLNVFVNDKVTLTV